MPSTHAHIMQAGDLAAAFLPTRGMLGVSLTHRGDEILSLVDDLEGAATTGRSIGVPLLHPWANRLRGTRYQAAGRTVDLDPESPWLLRDWNQVILHGVPWSKLDWQLVEADATTLVSRLPWARRELLEVFPYRHEVVIRATLDATGLTMATTVIAGDDGPVPVSFGYHPYVHVPGLPRAQWRLVLPAMDAIELDALLLPTGRRVPFPAVDAPLDDMDFDHGFALTTAAPTMSVAGAGRRVSVDFLDGYRFAQIYAPPGHDYISFEPMVAPSNALCSGEALPVLQPGERHCAVFRIRVEAIGDA